MPIYEFRCQRCHETHESFMRMNQDSSRERCACGGRCSKIPSRIHRERHFAGTEGVSLQEGCHSREVGRVRRLLGSSMEHVVRDDGSVVFANRTEQRKYVKTVDAEIERVEAQAAAIRASKRSKATARPDPPPRLIRSAV